MALQNAPPCADDHKVRLPCIHPVVHRRSSDPEHFSDFIDAVEPLVNRSTVSMIIGQQHIPLTANGYRCQTADLWRLLLAAAARRTTLEAACADLTGAPDANTVRGYLTEQLPPAGIPDLEQQWNGLLRTLIPDWLRARPQEIAVDFHDEPYYGRDDPEDDDNWVCHGEARAGTTRFYRCATAYLMRTICG